MRGKSSGTWQLTGFEREFRAHLQQKRSAVNWVDARWFALIMALVALNVLTSLLAAGKLDRSLGTAMKGNAAMEHAALFTAMSIFALVTVPFLLWNWTP